VNLEKDANVNFVVKERKTSDNRVVLNTLRNLVSVIQKNDKLMEDKQVQACISAQEAIDTQQEAITELDERYTKMMSRCELLRQNIESVGSNQAQADQFNTWVSELDTATNEITAIDDDKRPEAEDNLRELNITLRAELKKLSLSWEK
jgi:D-ribose pyranose/furanose isomerase RbsD